MSVAAARAETTQYSSSAYANVQLLNRKPIFLYYNYISMGTILYADPFTCTCSYNQIVR